MAHSTIFILALVALGISVISCRHVPDYSNVPFGTITEMMFSKYVKFTCPVIYGRYPHPENCEYFYECRFGKPTLMHCNRGYLYDRQREHCRDRRTVKCHIEDGKGHDHHRDHKDHKDHKDKDIQVKEDMRYFKCPYTWGTFAHPYECSKYFVCIYNTPKLFQCNHNFLYDDRYRKCLPQNRVNCGNRLDRDQMRTSKKPIATTVGPMELTTSGVSVTTESHSKFYCPFPYGRYPDPEDCSRYYECRFSVPHLYVCPKYTLYDERKEKCHDEKRVKCGARPGGNDGGHSKFYCPFPYGRYPDPEDCSRYYECRFSVPHLYVCPKSTLYDERKEKCHDERHVKCGARPGGNDGDPSSFDKTTFTTLTPSTMKKIPETTKSSETPTVVTATPSTTATPVPTTATSTTSTTITPFPTTETSTTSTTVTPFPTTATPTTTTTTTPVPTTATSPTTATPVPTTATSPTTTTPIPTTANSPTTTTPIPTTATPSPTTTPASTTTTSPTTFAATTTTPAPTTFTTLSPLTTTRKLSTPLPVTKPNTPPPTDCDNDDLDCIIDGTGDVVKWFDCPRRFGHFPHGSSRQLFIHCDNGRPFVKKCAEETFFSPTYHVCVWADKTKGLQ